jgi:integrase
MEAFFGCLYYAALQPAEAVALREADCVLPRRG